MGTGTSDGNQKLSARDTYFWSSNNFESLLHDALQSRKYLYEQYWLYIYDPERIHVST